MPELLDPETLLQAYAMGIFPMAESRDDPEIHWVDPRRRGILPLDGFHVSRSFGRVLQRTGLTVTVDQDFAATVSACADRPETWISHRIQGLYAELHRRGHAHSIEVRDAGRLVGGVYGVCLGAAFFGESMFSRVPNASKIALAHAVQRLRAGGFHLFDTQFLTPHLASLGAVEITRSDYHARLAKALAGRATFFPAGYSPGCSFGAGAASGRTQDRTQTS